MTGGGRHIRTVLFLLTGASCRVLMARAVPHLAETAGGGHGGLRGAVVLVGEGLLALAQSGKQQPDQDELGEVYPETRRLGREHVQNARSARALGMHGSCSTECQGGLGGLDANKN